MAITRIVQLPRIKETILPFENITKCCKPAAASAWIVVEILGVHTSEACVIGCLLKDCIALDNQSRMIRRLRAKLAIERRESAAIKKEHEGIQVALEASHKTIAGLTEIGLSMSKKIERMKAKKQQAREAIWREKASLLQTIQGLQEENDDPAPFDDEWEEEAEEEPEEEGL
ncbi:hypothetical protein F511_41697 [Dorcoceras hygrometricum]|uniref:Uncharacterized protein n=1 Tax=Dorcoceras hygrometricum TaxID=472368 RepID=A0A2Z7BSS2_9LAMI|nr:hypothetical protein F511_41697 [Dorcoceras hygrometricum]